MFNKIIMIGATSLFLVNPLVTIGNFFVETTTQNVESEQYEIVEKNGFQVVENESHGDYSTIIARVTSFYDSGYAVQNIYDSEDVFYLEHNESKKGYRVGDNLKITFFHDSVDKVVKVGEME